jgi:signal recognition particle GTPase
VEQVKVWGERSRVEVIANPGKNTDPAAVVYDGIEAAKSREIELLLVDTAGRLQNKKNLMAELSKIRRIIDKKAESAVVESLLSSRCHFRTKRACDKQKFSRKPPIKRVNPDVKSMVQRKGVLPLP